MPSILSKILIPEWNLPYNCYELGHTWTPFCTAAALEIGLIVFEQSIKLYAPLYIGHQILRRKFDGKSFIVSFQDIIRSSSFLGVNSFLVILFFCLTRHLLGRFYYSLCAYLPSFCGSFLALHVERSSRRQALAFYVANIASETLYRVLVSRGYIVPIPHGQLILFSLATTLLIFLNEQGLIRDPLIKFVFKLVLGSNLSNTHQSVETNNQSVKNGWSQRIRQIISETFSSNRSGPSYCSHPNSCLEEVIINGTIKTFIIGYTSQLMMNTIPRALSLRADFFSQYLFNMKYLMSWRHVSTGLFLASFVTIYKSTRCLIRNVTCSDSPYHSLVGCLLASPSHLIAPSSSVTLYLVWKCIETFFTLATHRGLISYNQLMVHILYSIATAQLFFSAVLEPKHIKPSYKRFLDRITHNKLAYINRNVLDLFGTNSSSGYESFLPSYDIGYTTRRFQESVLVWLL